LLDKSSRFHSLFPESLFPRIGWLELGRWLLVILASLVGEDKRAAIAEDREESLRPKSRNEIY
jgi:hypothetical protein